MKTLVYLECKDGALVGSSLEQLTLGKTLGEVTAVLAGTGLEEVARQAAVYGVPVLVAQGDASTPDAALYLLEQMIHTHQPDLVLFSATQAGKDYAPRLAARLDSGCVTDATQVEAKGEDLVVIRPAYGGTVIEKLRMAGGAPRFATVRSGSYEKPAVGEAAAVTVEEIAVPDNAVKARVKEAAKEIAELVDLEGADVIVAGGRGMGTAEGFRLVKELAALLGGVVGASRPAIEEEWISRAHQIGQSGKTVAPRLYIACGISGAMQHISGVMGAKYIVAINQDADASIFKIADVGIVGDAREILPALMDAIRQRREG